MQAEISFLHKYFVQSILNLYDVMLLGITLRVNVKNNNTNITHA